MQYIKGKNAIITGVNSGLGLAFCKALVLAGAHVVGWGRSAPEEPIENFHFIPTELDQAISIENSLQQSLEWFPEKRIDFLITNAGLGRFYPIEQMPESLWDEQISINLKSMFLCVQKVVPLMKAKGSGHIVTLSSVAGKTGASWGTAYSATKFGVVGFSESLFQEVRASGIKVSVVYPGSTKTNFFDTVPGISTHDNMLTTEAVANTVLHILNTDQNTLISEVVIRPLNSKPPEK